MTATLQPTDTRTHGVRNLSKALCELAELHFRLGDWWSAQGCAHEAVRTARASGREQQIMNALARLALVEAGLGRADACRAHVAEAARLSRGLVDAPVKALAGEALAFLELGLGRVAVAIDHLEEIARVCREHPRACTLARSWPLHLADAQVRVGNRTAAQGTLEWLGARATRTHSCVLAAGCERTRAMLAADDAFDPIFRRALQWNVWAQQPFERARTQLCFGERLRRAGRDHEARGQLVAALETFEALGARPWAEAAGRELAPVAA